MSIPGRDSVRAGFPPKLSQQRLSSTTWERPFFRFGCDRLRRVRRDRRGHAAQFRVELSARSLSRLEEVGRAGARDEQHDDSHDEEDPTAHRAELVCQRRLRVGARQCSPGPPSCAVLGDLRAAARSSLTAPSAPCVKERPTPTQQTPSRPTRSGLRRNPNRRASARRGRGRPRLLPLLTHGSGR